MESWICNFYLSVEERKIVFTHTLACCWDVKQASNQPTTPSIQEFIQNFLLTKSNQKKKKKFTNFLFFGVTMQSVLHRNVLT